MAREKGQSIIEKIEDCVLFMKHYDAQKRPVHCIWWGLLADKKFAMISALG